MNRILTLLILFGLGLLGSGCRSSSEPNQNTFKGLRATIDGVAWVADTVHVKHSGSCLTVLGWTGSGPSVKSVMITFPDWMASADSCQPAGASYGYTGGETYLEHAGSLHLDNKTSSNLTGRFISSGLIFRNTDTTHITNGEFNVDY